MMKKNLFVLLLSFSFALPIYSQTKDTLLYEYMFLNKDIYKIIDSYVKNKAYDIEMYFYGDNPEMILFKIENYRHNIKHLVGSKAYGYVKYKKRRIFLFGDTNLVIKKRRKAKFKIIEAPILNKIIDPDVYIFKLYKKTGMIFRVG